MKWVQLRDVAYQAAIRMCTVAIVVKSPSPTPFGGGGGGRVGEREALL